MTWVRFAPSGPSLNTLTVRRMRKRNVNPGDDRMALLRPENDERRREIFKGCWDSDADRVKDQVFLAVNRNETHHAPAPELIRLGRDIDRAAHRAGPIGFAYCTTTSPRYKAYY
jgi:hypothetical protein